jgi:lipoyl(octanoyl) transferase
MLDVRRRFGDVHGYINALEGWIIDALALLGTPAERRPGYVGVWVRPVSAAGEARPEKIAAIGVRLRHWVSSHGFSLNVAPDLAHFSGIVPCGIHDAHVTSLAELGIAARYPEVDRALRFAFERRFGRARAVPCIVADRQGAPAPA